MKRMIGAVSILILLSACASPFWGQKDDSERQQTVQTEPLSDGELVVRLTGFSFSAVEEPRGVSINLEDLSFASGKAELNHRDRKSLRDLAKVLNHPLAAERPIAVEGHTDSTGSAAYNLHLSEKRAQAVAQELIFNQTPAERIAVRGYGEQYPIVPNTNPNGSDNPTARAQNRRVEIIIGHAEEGKVQERDAKR